MTCGGKNFEVEKKYGENVKEKKIKIKKKR
jgi:hypothetical protein